MAKSISSLAVILSGSAKGFDAMIGTSEKKLAGFSSGIKTAVAGLAGGLSIYGIKSWADSTISAVGAVKDQADGLSMTTDAFTRLSYAVGLAGVSGETLNSAMLQTNKFLADSVDINSEAAKTMRDLGLNTAELMGLSPEQQFSKLVDALNGVSNTTMRADAASKIFGKGYKSLMPVINAGADSLERSAMEADRLGITISQFDASRIDDAGDAMETFGKAIDGASAKIIGEMSPYITIAANKLAEIGANKWGDYTLKAIEWVASGMAWVADVADVLKIAFKALQVAGEVALYGLLKGIDLLGAGVTALINLIPGVEVQWTNLFDELAQGAWEAADQANRGMEDAWENFGGGRKKVNAFFDGIREESEKLKQQQIDDQVEADRKRAESAKLAALDMAAAERDATGKTSKDKKAKSAKAETVLSQTIMAGAAGSLKAIAEIKNNRAERIAEQQLETLKAIAANTKKSNVNIDDEEVI